MLHWSTEEMFRSIPFVLLCVIIIDQFNSDFDENVRYGNCRYGILYMYKISYIASV